MCIIIIRPCMSLVTVTLHCSSLQVWLIALLLTCAIVVNHSHIFSIQAVVLLNLLIVIVVEDAETLPFHLELLNSVVTLQIS